MPHRGVGPIPSRIMLVGEAYGEDEERLGEPFVGRTGQELNRLLHEVNIMRTECFITNVVNYRPADNNLRNWIAFKKDAITPVHVQFRDLYVLPIVVEGYKALMTEIAAVQPNIIVAFGNLSLWALVPGCIKLSKNGTGLSGILKWRGSQLSLDKKVDGTKIVPTVHPAAIFREYPIRYTIKEDLRRVRRQMTSREWNPPKWEFVVRPSFDKVMNLLVDLRGLARHRLPPGELWIDLDIETRAGHIACIGLSWSRTAALVIPFMCVESLAGYWSEDEEAQIVQQLYLLLTNKGVSIRWQNGLYDAQYIHKWWHFIPRGCQDTMISQHAIFSDLPKALAYQASMYCDWYVYWKEEGKNWDPSLGEEQFWNYNGQDCVYTRECGEVELETVKKMGLEEVHSFQQAMFYPVLQAMLRGIRVIPENQAALAAEVQEEITRREGFLTSVLGHPINPDSPLQMTKLFYEDLQQPPIWSRATKNKPSHITCDDDALQKIGAREPILKPLVNAIADIRTLQKFLGFIEMKLDWDGRARCSFNIGGSESGKSAPKTYRLSSSKSAFGSGANLQTIPSEKSKSVGKAEARGGIALLGDPYALPNIRSMFGPDPGFTMFDLDLDRADLHVMAWDADEKLLKEILRRGVDVHLFNAFILDAKEPPPLDELVETHPKYWDHRGPMKHKREFAKVFCHATDYLGKARTVAAHTARTVHEIERAQRIYLGAYKGIALWQSRVIHDVQKHRFVVNRFGYKWHIFDRIDDSVMPEAVAWIPQSTVSRVINGAWLNIYNNLPEVNVLLQVHDSLVGQFPTHLDILARIKEECQITVPYDDPLIIPVGIKTSAVSWGDCA